MRVLLISSSYPPVLGGLQTVAHALACYLTHRGHNVQVVTNRYPRSLPAQEVLDGVPVYRWLFLTPDLSHFGERRPDLFLASFYFFPSTLFRLTRLMRTFRPEVVNLHFPDAQVPFVHWLRRWFDFRLVVSLHGHEIERWFLDEPSSIVHYLSSMLRHLRLILQEADAVTACSHYLLDKAIQLESSVAEKGCVIHNGIDPKRFKDKTLYPHPRPYVLAYGRLTYQKGFDMLLDAFAQVAPRHPAVDLVLAGDGEQGEALREQVRRLELENQVHFFGQATPKEVVQLLNGCLFIVVPSRLDTFGIVALEALATGKAVLATRVGGLPALLDDSVHRLVEPTVDGMAEGLGEWLARHNEIMMLGERNRDRAVKYAWPQVAKRYWEAYSGG
jgi:glycogen(starch) synthase